MPNPQPHFRKRHFAKLIWFIPLFAAIGAGVYLHLYLKQQGPLITIAIDSADGIKTSATPLLHHGVPIGTVTDIRLSKDRSKALVDVRLQRDQEAFAHEGSEFWVVRPEVRGTDFQALGTIFSGPYLDSIAGSGERKTFFQALSKAPLALREGLDLVLHAPKIDHLQENSPVLYRGIEVGAVRDIRLSPNANEVEIRLVVWKRYAPLVYENTKFWPITGFDVKGGLFSGINLQFRSFKELVSGGIAFATPDQNRGNPAKPGTDFALQKQSQDEWLAWAPKIAIHPGDASPDESAPRENPVNRVHSMAGKAAKK